MNDQNKTRQQLIDELVQLRQQVADQRQLNDKLPILVITAAFDGYFKEVNAACERILGWSEEELLSRPVIEFIHPEDRAVVAKHFERLKAGKTPGMFVDRMLSKNGSYRWISWVVVLLLDQGTAFGLGKDISDQMQTMLSCREIEERYRHMVDSTPDVLYILDRNGSLLYANRVAGMYYGMNPELLIGKTQQDLFPPEKTRIHLEHIEKVFETGQMEELDGLYQFGDRKVRLNIRTIPLRDHEGRVTSVMGICRDITNGKRPRAPIAS